MKKIVIVQRKDQLLLLLLEESGKPSLLRSALLPEKEGLLGSIYIGKVKDVAPSISAAFVSIGTETVFLPFPKEKEPVFLNRSQDSAGQVRLKQGDELLLQITGEAQKTKQPTASTGLSLTGKYCVCSTEGKGISYSKKLTPEQKDMVKDFLAGKSLPNRKAYHFTIRTNAGMLSNGEPLLSEMQEMITDLDRIREISSHRTCFSCMYRPKPEILGILNDIPLSSYEEIVTDVPSVLALLKEEQGAGKLEGVSLRFYEDSLLPLEKLYSVDTHLQEVFSKRVWLPCGGYLIIEPTEAMVVIDVNSGKAMGKKTSSEAFYLKVNEEAAVEIARQLRLRNYSGMIMVDFISMEAKENKDRLLARMAKELEKDPVPARLVDMTALGIVEITRKKVNKPLDSRLL